jgi:hypothetical protein
VADLALKSLGHCCVATEHRGAQSRGGSDEWGIASVRSRIVTCLEAFLEAATAGDLLPGLRGTALALREHLSKRWPDTTPLPVYPAFRV